MRFDSGLLVHAGDPDGYPPVAEWRETARLLESSGFTTLWCAEHHFFWDGWTQPTPTNPLQFGAFVASQTTTLRLGQCGVCMPDWHPLRVAEDVAMLDHMSDGRVDFGMIRGLNSRVAGNFHPDADRRDQGRNQALFWESYDIVRKAWAGPFRHEGRFYTLPRPEWYDRSVSPDSLDRDHYAADGELVALSVRPLPYQKPGPPSWLMADSLGSSLRGVENDLGVISWGQTFEATREVWAACREALRAKWGDQASTHERLGIMRPVFVARTDEEAEAVMRPAVNLLLDHIAGLTPAWDGRKAWAGRSEELTDADIKCDWFDFLNAHDWCLIGSPRTVTERIKRFQAELGCEHLINYWALPLITFEQFIESTTLFANEVMPNF